MAISSMPSRKKLMSSVPGMMPQDILVHCMHCRMGTGINGGG